MPTPRSTRFSEMEFSSSPKAMFTFWWPTISQNTYGRNQREKLMCRGGPVRTLAGGNLFKLQHFPREKANREYLILSSALEIRAGQQQSGALSYDFSCCFRVQPATVVYRLRRELLYPGQWFSVCFSCRAIGRRIWIDCYSRVKVHFLWDRYGKFREGDSCWLRVNLK